MQDFEVVNRELYLWDEALRNTPQVVVINKVDVPHVADRLDSIIAQLKAACGHTRVVGISAERGDYVKVR